MDPKLKSDSSEKVSFQPFSVERDVASSRLILVEDSVMLKAALGSFDLNITFCV
jgi:hypothetical protein